MLINADYVKNDQKINFPKNTGKANLKPNIKYGKLPLYFIPNNGQVNEKAKFYVKASRYTLWLTREGFVFDSVKKVKVEAEVEEEAAPFGQIINAFGKDTNKNVPGKFLSPDIHASMQYHSHSPHSPKIERDVSRFIFLNANKNPEIVPLEGTEHRVNYFIGNDKSKWKTDIKASKAVLYKNVYKNINLKVYGIEKQIEYDWIVKPGGNPDNIIFEYRNVKETRIDDKGNLVIETEFGEMKHKKPISYQIIKTQKQKGTKTRSKNIKVMVNFKKNGKNTFKFEVGEYDKKYDLIIDPVFLTHSTYLGGSGDDRGYGIAVDSSGNAYVTGRTNGTDFPAKSPYMTDAGIMDAFVTKLSVSGNSLIYSTYLGGDYYDSSVGIVVDSSGNAYVTGYTSSTDFPTKNPYMTDPGDGYYNAFVTKLSSTGNSLIYSTYLGGGDSDQGDGIAVDGSGNAYVTGNTWSTDFPTENPYMNDLNGVQDAFVTKLSSSGSSLIYSTYLGGGDYWDEGYGIAVDSSGNAYVTGHTSSTDFPTKNPYMTDPGDSDTDVFITKLSASGNSLIYSTYLGGNNDDQGKGIAVDSSGGAYVIGYTLSPDFPTKNPYMTDPGDGYYDAFVTKLSPTGDSLIYSTYLGGSHFDSGMGIAVNSSGSAYVTGFTGSTDFPTKDPYMTDPGDGWYDAFVTKLSSTGDSLIYSTYLGGSYYERGYGIAVNSSGSAYVTGYTGSTDFPTKNPYMTDPWDNDDDVFVTKLGESSNLEEKDPPFGSFDTPTDGSTVRSSIAVTGWALDDTGIGSVKIYRAQGNNLIYIGDSILVEGARPDVAAAYPGYPNNTSAGWGYMMLTTFLPNSGNGTFVIHAIAADLVGKTTTLGTKTIHCDNANAVKPFGAIDTPTQGGAASGSNFRNQGWVLTPMPNQIPIDGSTIDVYVDSVNLGHPIYNLYREDIAALFPGYINSNGAHAYFDFDTTNYDNGVHLIFWTAADNAGNSDGIGSRYFTIQNTGSSRPKIQAANTQRKVNGQAYYRLSQMADIPIIDWEPIRIKKGFKRDCKTEAVNIDEKGIFNITMKELDRIEIELSNETFSTAGYTVTGNHLRPLPIGSTLDKKTGKFYWYAGPGFIGDYWLVFIERSVNNRMNRKNVVIRIDPKPGNKDR
jgi:hypothetical protein